MRRLSTTVSVFLLACGLFAAWPVVDVAYGVAHAQAAAASDSTALGRVERAFRTADVDVLLDGAADRLDVIIFGKSGAYSRAQAALVLQDFFRRNPPARVSFEQEVLAEDRRSIIGTYWAAESGAEPVAVFVRLRARDAGWQLRSVRIERAGDRR